MINKSTPNREREGISLYWWVIPVQNSLRRNITLQLSPACVTQHWPFPWVSTSHDRPSIGSAAEGHTVVVSRPNLYINQFKILSNLGKQKAVKVLFCNLKCKSLHKIVDCLWNSLRIPVFRPCQFYSASFTVGKSCLTKVKANNILKGLKHTLLFKPSLCCQGTRRISDEQEVSLGNLILIFPPYNFIKGFVMDAQEMHLWK